LDENAKILLDRLSVFPGGCTLEAAEAVCDPEGELGGEVVEGLAALIDQSLLWQRDGPGGEPRFGMLDTIREFAAEKLEARGRRRRRTGGTPASSPRWPQRRSQN
jgi:hypothetical protein